MKTLLLTVLFCGVLVHAQDTYKCPDGWRKWESDRNGECRCFFYSSREMVTKDDADVLCEAGHPGSWVAEIDYPSINYFIKSDLLQMTEIGQYEQFWLGAYTTERHGQGNPGDWIWPHMNKTVEWADWADGEPNDYYGEQCVVMREYHNPFFPVARDYFWNDFDCQASAHYICESACSTY